MTVQNRNVGVLLLVALSVSEEGGLPSAGGSTGGSAVGLVLHIKRERGRTLEERRSASHGDHVGVLGKERRHEVGV